MSVTNQTCARQPLVLLVEDDAVLRYVAQVNLSRNHVPFHIANSGQDAVEMVKSNCYSLILMDVQMPGMSGLEAARLIKNQPNGRDATILAFTSSDEDRASECLSAGMDGFVTKPANFDTVLNEWLH